MEDIWHKVEDVDENEDEDEDALSLSDLPLIQKKVKENDEDEEEGFSDLPREAQIQEEFDFCSFSKKSEMCTADEVFFRGQILPLRHSVSSEKGSWQHFPNRPISRSESMDRIYSSGLISSRSSSISSSHQSSSSGSSVSNLGPKFKPRFPTRNQFLHSHPSPSPRISKPGSIHPSHRNSTKKSSPSSIWNIFRLGLVTPPPEIAFQDLKSRCPSTNFKNLGSRNSASSQGSSISSSKRKARTLLTGGCRCTSDAVATVPSRIVTIRRSASEGEVRHRQREPERTVATKKQLSHNRTFEWIKQLSLQAAPDAC